VVLDARIVCGAVACVPWRVTAVERALVGAARNAETADKLAQLATDGAQALNFNQFKLPLMENLVRRAIRGA
jgi:xanthine dehydrogenase YagS FAD-binding subunit